MRILVLGVTGMLGHKLWQRLSDRFPQTYGTLRAPRSAYAACELFRTERAIDCVDATRFSELAAVLDRVGPDVVVNCIALTKRRNGAEDALSCIELNAALPHRLAGWAAAHGARVLHFSTDCVFDGRAGGYDELSPTSAEDLYGRTKALGEIAGPGLLTLRTSFIGRELGAGTELLEWLLAQRGGPIRGYRNALYTGVATTYMAQLVDELLTRFPRLDGLYHVSAPVVSKLELLTLAKQAYNVPVEIDPDDTVVMRRNLDGTRFRRATGIDVPAWSVMMQALAHDPTPYERWKRTDAA